MTRYKVGLLGHGIGPSLSPAMHMREAEHLGLEYEYRTVDLIDSPDVDLGAELSRLEAEGFVATNVTHPYKLAVLEYVDERSDVVRRVGSANLVLLGEGRRTAHNTDCTGFRAALELFLAGRPAGGTVVQVGAGGAGLATASSLVDMDLDRVVVHDLNEDATSAMVQRFAEASGGRLVTSGGRIDEWLPVADGVVHVTPTGMKQHPGVAIDVERLRPSAWVAEVVYFPLETELVRRARARGLATLDGGGMAVGQAVDSLRLITGREPNTARMHAHFDELIASADRAGH
ncbi:shikimate dehydrogenase [Solicola gregarius]|uniref:Shikimate dehydrogenase n=1 Tax=Solicola gregarius TaxID=2908642 RepID=A0AA46TJT7_9ACTN|nr:shikimate dehydrogenase [Solicola gregarius]UYM06616.1 shikimate dehydrogenase [Solicola gregarius]